MQRYSRYCYVSDHVLLLPQILFMHMDSYPCGHLICSVCLATSSNGVVHSSNGDSGHKTHICIVCATECDNTDPRIVPGLDNLKSAITDENILLWISQDFCGYLYLFSNIESACYNQALHHGVINHCCLVLCICKTMNMYFLIYGSLLYIMWQKLLSLSIYIYIIVTCLIHSDSEADWFIKWSTDTSSD